MNQTSLNNSKSAKRPKDLTDSNFSDLNLNPALPISSRAEEIQNLLKNNQVLIVAGETGCGKTTQLPQICLNAGYQKIAHTQPRRVAATSVATRIASELKTELGNEVGYAVRFSEQTSRITRIKLMTDGILLAELQSDPLLNQYDVIIIDEAHERSLNIDFLLGFIKQLLQKRSNLKLIVTSATIDPQSFSQYFDNAPVLMVEGRTFPVEVIYQPIGAPKDIDTSGNKNLRANSNGSDEDDSDLMEQAIIRAMDTCISSSTGDILIFSYGEAEIRQLTKIIQAKNYSQLLVLPLYARLGIKEQQAIFSSSHQRKVIIATNVAETSLTIPNILFVIDLGMARISRYSQRNKIQQLPIEKISKASANQRKGRSGRIAPGLCIRLYDEEDFNSRIEYTQPEIRRTNLSSVVLRLKSLGVNQVESFPFIQAPDERQWKVAFNLLFEIGAVDKQKFITGIGKEMSRLPIDPQLARILLVKDSGAIEEMLVITSFLGVRDIRIRPPNGAAKGAQQKADECHKRFHDPSSDIMSVINMWNQLNETRNTTSNAKFRKWCQNNFINFIGWLEWKNTYRQLKMERTKVMNTDRVSSNTVLSKSKNVSSSNNKSKIIQPILTASAEQVHQALIPGFVSHILMKTPDKHYQGARGLKVWLHPSSIFFKKSPQWLLSLELVETNKIYARNNLPVKPEWFERHAKHLLKNNYQDIHWSKKKGQAAAFLNQSLFGLPIVNKRLIDYGKVDPMHGRKLFLSEGLVANQVFDKLPFLTHNQNQTAQIVEEQDKLRRADLLIEEEEYAALYDHIIPNGIRRVYNLKKWLKKDWQSRNESLSFSKEQLTAKESSSQLDYPSEIFVNGVELPVSYSFAPGQPEDGIHVTIPTEMLSQFREIDFEWLVPGYLKDKIIATLKNLPKPIRKQLIPISETAEQCLFEIIRSNGEFNDYQSKDFRQALRDSIVRTKALTVSLDDFDTKNLPHHLKMKYVGVQNSNNRANQASYFSQLSELRNTVEKKSNLNNTKKGKPGQNKESTKITEWPDDGLQLNPIIKQSGLDIRIFQGLSDENGCVMIRRFPSLKSAKNSHQSGIKRLILIQQQGLIKELVNKWQDRQIMERLTLRIGGFSIFLDWLIGKIILTYIDEHTTRSGRDIETKQQFKSLAGLINECLRSEIAVELSSSKKLLEQTQAIYLEIEKLSNNVYQKSCQDILSQLCSLWSEQRIVQKGKCFESDYERYLAGLSSRIGRLQENYPREAKVLDEWLEWLEWWKELEQIESSYEVACEIAKLFWQLEEYRISLFAINIKTKEKISAKRLQNAFDRLEKMIERNQ